MTGIGMSSSALTSAHTRVSAASLYVPKPVRVRKIIRETHDVCTFQLEFVDPVHAAAFTYRTGQFGEFSVFGVGEATFNISSSPNWKGYFECCFRKIGLVTGAMARLKEGDVIGFRGPYGNSYDLDAMHGRDLIFAAGGIGFPPIRCLVWRVLEEREKFGSVVIVHGARSHRDLIYQREMAEWSKRRDIHMIKTVDPGGDPEGWDGEVGFVPTVLEERVPWVLEREGKGPANAMAFTCGPPVMTKFVIQALTRMGIGLEQIVLTLENKMKCAVGKCGRCNIGSTYVCLEGPIFNAAQVRAMPDDQ
ncbi:MAG: FAD/NAD(P)-binding protein [Nitrospirota bacterium]|nr:FAD/NAD(P)-binding protein [Nitrospirota bacterium]